MSQRVRLLILYPSDVKRSLIMLLSSSHLPVHGIDSYGQFLLSVVSDNLQNIRDRLLVSNAAVCDQQHKLSSPVTLKVGDSIMMLVPERGSKLSPKFMGPCKIIKHFRST